MNNKLFGRRQLLSLGSAVMLSPALRLFPQQSSVLAGRAAWLTPLAAFPLLLVYMLFLSRFMGCRRDGEGLAELTLRALGRIPGRVVLGIIALWMLLYTGFILRSGASRLVETIYPRSSPAPFSVVMGLLALVAALGSPRTVVRAGRMICPLLIAALLIFAVGAVFDMDAANLWPVTAQDLLPVLSGALIPTDILSCTACALCFFAGGLSEKGEGSFRALALWTAGFTFLLTLLSVALTGRLGTEICVRLTHPFFVLVRNMVFFRSLERIEALVVTLWIFPDFLLTSLFLWAGQHSLRLALGKDAQKEREKPFDFSSGRWIVWLSAAAAIVCALLIAPDSVSLALWSEKIIPIANLGLAFIVFPLIYIIGKERKKL